MGVIHHHAVIATTWSEENFNSVIHWLKEKFGDVYGDLVVISTKRGMNGYRSIALLPDGSKEGWDASEFGDAFRAAFLRRLKEDEYEDGSSPWSFVEVGFGELGADVVSTN